MSTSIYDELITIIKSYLDVEEITPDSELEALGFSSYEFVKIVVEIEMKFGFEFDDEYLDFRKFKTIGDLTHYIDRMVKSYA